MGRGKRKRVTARVEYVDATPERIAMGESEFVNPAEIDSSEQSIGLTRRFKVRHLDRLHRADDDKSPITLRQWHAGDQYYRLYHRAAFRLAVVASYGERTTGGDPSYGLPITDDQLRASKRFGEARKVWPKDMLGFMDRLIIHNEFPRYAGRAAMRNMDSIRKALDTMADHFKISC